jgi:hypothetical protein
VYFLHVSNRLFPGMGIITERFIPLLLILSAKERAIRPAGLHIMANLT